MRTVKVFLGSLLLSSLFTFSLPERAKAMPIFARKYQTSCSTCHYAYPELNAFGYAFEANGYRFPAGTDPDLVREKPVDLGSEGQKRAFPDAIWPGDIPGSAPIAFHFNQVIHFNKNTPKVSFQFPSSLDILTAGTLGQSFSYFGEISIENANEVSYQFRFQYDCRPQFHIRVGNIDNVCPILGGRRLTHAEYAFSSTQAVDDENTGGNPAWHFGDAQNGIELWGRTNGPKGRGGFRYAFGLVNGQTNDSNNAVKSPEDVFLQASYKFGGLGEIGGTEGQGGAKSAFYRDNSLRLGGYAYFGRSQYDGFKDKFKVLGGMWDLWYGRLSLHGVYHWQKDNDVVNPPDTEEKVSKAWFNEAHGVIYPWLIALGRYEWTKPGADAAAAKTFIPGLITMIRANIRVTLEGDLPLNDRASRDWQYVARLDVAF